MDAEADWGRAAAHYVVSILRLPDPLVEHDMHMIRAFVASLHDTTDTHRESVNTPFQLSGQATHTRTHTRRGHILPDIRLPMSYLIILTQFAVTVRRRKV